MFLKKTNHQSLKKKYVCSANEMLQGHLTSSVGQKRWRVLPHATRMEDAAASSRRGKDRSSWIAEMLLRVLHCPFFVVMLLLLARARAVNGTSGFCESKSRTRKGRPVDYRERERDKGTRQSE